jgi:serine/threonine protein kinase
LPWTVELAMIGAMTEGGKANFGPGDRIGDYEVLAPLGAGGMGSVYKVRHAISNRLEALKIILPNSAGASEMAERFLREIRLLASLEHPHIASLHNAFRSHDQLVMVMEFVDGVSLRDKLHSSGITLGQALEYATQVLGALAYAHARGVIHRDIKPSNVMIASDGVVKLLDFGLAMSSATAGVAGDNEADATRSQEAELTLTQPGTLLGSPYYISPEQARGERADARSDLYSTGAMLYEMVAGSPPFNGGGGGAYTIIAAHLHQTPRSPAEVNPGVPPELARIILTALAKSPAERFSTAGEFLAALKSIQLDAVRWNDTSTVAMPSLRPAAQDVPPESKAVAEDRSVHSDADLERVSKDLATYIGPIAHILVRRAAPDNRTLSALYQTLAQEISSLSKREQFLASMPQAPLSRSASGRPSGGSRTSG